MQMILIFSIFSAADFAFIVILILNKLYLISTIGCYLAFFLTFPPKLFLFTGFQQQLLKLSYPIIHLPNDVTLSPVDSGRNLGVTCDGNLTFLNTFQLFFNHAFIICVTSDATAILIVPQPAVLLLLLFTINLTIGCLFY